MLSKLIEALQIFLKYDDPTCPTHCEHDELSVIIDPAKVSKEDKAKLEELKFYADGSEGCFKSFWYGSA